jgi:hypothetical protein
MDKKDLEMIQQAASSGTIEISGDVNSSRLGHTTVLLNTKTESYLGMDEVGSRIWELLAEYRRVDLIVQRLLSEYEVDEATLRADVERFVSELVDKGLVTIA